MGEKRDASSPPACVALQSASGTCGGHDLAGDYFMLPSQCGGQYGDNQPDAFDVLIGSQCGASTGAGVWASAAASDFGFNKLY
jgi:hypothetical protein